MGRYSRKDMIEFANFAKSWQSPQTVEVAYQRYFKGDRLIIKRKKRNNSNDLMRIECYDVEKNLVGNVACTLHIEPVTCGCGTCLKCKNYVKP